MSPKHPFHKTTEQDTGPGSHMMSGEQHKNAKVTEVIVDKGGSGSKHSKLVGKEIKKYG